LKRTAYIAAVIGEDRGCPLQLDALGLQYIFLLSGVSPKSRCL
jgi:hypothetical protein